MAASPSSLALVTGNSGLLGNCLTTRLAERGVPMRLVDLAPASFERVDDHRGH